MGIQGKVSRNTLAHANQVRDCRIYADFAQILIARARRLYANDSFWRRIESNRLCIGLYHDRSSFNHSTPRIRKGTVQPIDFIRLTLGHYCTRVCIYVLDGKRIEIYKSQETYIGVNTKTEKYLTCRGLEHAHYVFKECVRTLEPEGRA